MKTRGQAITTLFACGAMAAIVVGTLAIVYQSQKQFEGKRAMIDEIKSDLEKDNETFGGCVVVSKAPSDDHRSVIRWRGVQAIGASPVDVLRATKAQMEREQQSDLGSDANARALALVLQAVAELEGKQAAMPDGTPIIQ